MFNKKLESKKNSPPKWVRILLALIHWTAFSGVVLANDAQRNEGWVQYPQRVSPRTPQPISTEGKSTWMQTPPPKSIEMGVRSESSNRGDTQNSRITYTDGTSNNLSQRAVSKEVTWAQDHVTKTTLYRFADGTEYREITRVEGTPQKPIYKQNKRTVQIDYADGTSSTVTTLAVDQRIAWTPDQKTKIATYTFPDGFIHQELSEIKQVEVLPSSEKNRREVVRTFKDGTTEKAIMQAASSKVEWLADHETRKTTYKFPDGSVTVDIEKIKPELGQPKYDGGVQTINIRYVDGYVKSQKNKAIRESSELSTDKQSKKITYFFEDGTSHTESVVVAPKLIGTQYDGDKQLKTWRYVDGSSSVVPTSATEKKEAWLSDRLRKKITYKFPDGSSNEVIEKFSPKVSESEYVDGVKKTKIDYPDGTTEVKVSQAKSEQITWSDDNLKKLITYKYADGSTHKETIEIPPKVSQPVYFKNTKSVTTTFGNGKTTVEKSIAITQEEIWSQDRQEKTTIYKFSDGSTSREIEKILAVKAKPTYEKGIQKFEVTYGDGTKSLITNFPIDQKISWGSDHVTKKTIDVFADGSKNMTLERVEPKLSQPKYDGHLQTIQKQYADGYSQTIVNSAIKTTVKWSDDHITKGVTYIFPDQTENTVVSKVLPVVTKVIYEGRLQLKFLRYGDGYETIEKNQPLSSKVTWENDHVTRKTEFVYADGAKNSITEKINPTSTKTSYTFDRQTKVITYADGYVDTQTEKALSSRVIWGNDHVTKTTTFRFTDGSLHEEIEKVPPVIQTPVYKSNEQKIVSVFGDGTTSTAINLATRMEDNWSRAKTERQITYEFPDGTKHTEYFLLNAEGVLVNLEDAVRSKEAKDDAKFSVKKFAFEGNTKFTSDELNQFLAKWVRDDVDMKSLKIAATVIANKYREVGYLAKAEVPTQEVKDGVVKLNVVESRLSEVVSSDPNNKTPVHALAIGMVKNAQMKDEVVHLDRMDKAAMLLSEIPGVQADLSLRPGEKKGETQAVVQIAPGKVMDGFVALDNAGARSTGYERVMSQVNMSGALDRAEQITTLVLQSKGSEFVKVGYSEPVGLSGWRLGFSVSDMRYQVISSDMLALNAHGPAKTRSVDLMGPIVRTQESSLNLQLTLDDKKFHNETFAGIQSKYAGQMLGINVQGSSYDNFLGGGLNTLGVQLVSGHLNLDGSPNQKADSETTQTAGEFAKIRINLGRQQKLDPTTAVVINYQTQLASKNLDGSEKLYLGGSQGIRAYAANEGGGSIGQLLSFELQRQRPIEIGQMSMAAFTDVGKITVNKFNDYPSALTMNQYALRGVGFWVGLNSTNRYGSAKYRLTWSRRLGLNPAASALGLDQDGTYIRDRFWFSANQFF